MTDKEKRYEKIECYTDSVLQEIFHITRILKSDENVRQLNLPDTRVFDIALDIHVKIILTEMVENYSTIADNSSR